mgnify:FL=1
MELFDTHAHYNDEKFDNDRKQVIQDIYNSNVTMLVNAGYSVESSIKGVEIAKDYDWMFNIVGVSPNDIAEGVDEIDKQISRIEDLVKKDQNIVKDVESDTAESLNIVNNNRKIVAIGEIGLDYYWNKENKALQKYAFIKQIELANKYNLPIVIHTREAVDDTIDILKNKIEATKKGVFHCCPLNRELVKQALKMGFYISFAGPVTFKNSKNANEIIQMVPLDKMVIETDSPYLAPEPHRGTRNDSRNVRYIAEKIANVKEISLEDIAKITYKNAMKIFEITDTTA